ncbi:MAG: TRL-like family protein [Spirochaetes bacterium]|nr:TRL-like family protein [Spirochaetota bacterium]MBU1079325.1 TRL-like family protein [Spirochaetota bacterium]
MKKALQTLALVLVVLGFVGCSTVRPFTATSNSIGQKTGEASVFYLFGYLPLGDADAGIVAAAKNGGIKTISVVDQKVAVGFFGTTVTTIVNGN